MFVTLSVCDFDIQFAAADLVDKLVLLLIETVRVLLLLRMFADLGSDSSSTTGTICSDDLGEMGASARGEDYCYSACYSLLSSCSFCVKECIC